MLRCTERPVLLTRLSAIRHAGWGYGPDARQSVPVGRRQVGSEHQASTSGSGTWAVRHDERTFVHAGEDDLSLFSQFAGILARGDIPPNALEVIRRGRMSALRKVNGGVRGIVVGDTLRRLVARTIVQQIGEAVERATSPFQYVLKTRAGCKCVSHMFQTLLDLDPRATILSVDGVGVFDLISRNAMMAGLSHLEEGDKLLPFVRLFYSSPSTFRCRDCSPHPSG